MSDTNVVQMMTKALIRKYCVIFSKGRIDVNVQ